MSKHIDVLTMYTKEQNQKTGRKGYIDFKREKEDIISPKNYGMFLNSRKKGKKVK